MDVFHVEEVGGHSIRDGVLCQALGLVFGKPDHVFGVDFDGIVVEFCLCDSLESS